MVHLFEKFQSAILFFNQNKQTDTTHRSIFYLQLYYNDRHDVKGSIYMLCIKIKFVSYLLTQHQAL